MAVFAFKLLNNKRHNKTNLKYWSSETRPLLSKLTYRRIHKTIIIIFMIFIIKFDKNDFCKVPNPNKTNPISTNNGTCILQPSILSNSF